MIEILYKHEQFCVKNKRNVNINKLMYWVSVMNGYSEQDRIC